MKKESIKIAKETISSIRRNIIMALTQIAEEHGGTKKEIDFEELDLHFVQSNTEDMILGFNSKGKLYSDNSEDETLKNLSVDLLILILEKLTQKLKLK
jgi:hypothetical protein